MTKTKLEKIVYSFHHPRSASGGRTYTQQRIIDRLYSPLYARNGGRHKAQYPQAALRGVDNQKL